MTVEACYANDALSLGERARVIPCPALLPRVGGPAAGLMRNKAFKRTDPKPSATVQVQVDNPGTGQFRDIRGVKDSKFDSIELHQAIECSNPKIAVGSLNHRRS